MDNFLEIVFSQLERAASRVVLREVHPDRFVAATGRQLLDQVAAVRSFLRGLGLEKDDRAALLGPNSIAWVVVDLALMAEGAIVVPLYTRQSAAELSLMIKDSTARFVFSSDPSLSSGLSLDEPGAPREVLFTEALAAAAAPPPAADRPLPRSPENLVTIIYTSGTSGEPKGVCLNFANLNHMIGCTTRWMDRLDHPGPEPYRVFQYLPFNFAASWIVLLSCLSRNTVLSLSTDLSRVAEEIRLSAPDYFFNVPALLERVRRAVEEGLTKRGALIQAVYRKAQEAWRREREGKGPGGLWLALGRKLIFAKVRERFGGNLRGLVSGSAPLAPDTQDFFALLGIPIWQVYGLTETCGICTMDDPRLRPEPSRVGQAIPGIELWTAENEEIVVRGPNVFPGYWNRPEETARVLKNGVFHTGDQGEVNSRGNWRISGRIKNLIILHSGHNIAPEPIEEKLSELISGAVQIVVVGHGRGYLSLLLTGAVDSSAVQSALDRLNTELPHYRQVRKFTILPEPFTAENGLLTANGKLRRESINTRFHEAIEQMYKPQAAAAGRNS